MQWKKKQIYKRAIQSLKGICDVADVGILENFSANSGGCFVTVQFYWSWKVISPLGTVWRDSRLLYWWERWAASGDRTKIRGWQRITNNHWQARLFTFADWLKRHILWASLNPFVLTPLCSASFKDTVKDTCDISAFKSFKQSPVVECLHYRICFQQYQTHKNLYIYQGNCAFQLIACRFNLWEQESQEGSRRTWQKNRMWLKFFEIWPCLRTFFCLNLTKIYISIGAYTKQWRKQLPRYLHPLFCFDRVFPSGRVRKLQNLVLSMYITTWTEGKDGAPADTFKEQSYQPRESAVLCQPSQQRGHASP